MPSLRSLLLAIAGATTLVVAAPCDVDGAQPPSQDPWYTEPKGFESAAPGSVLRVRPAPGNLTSIVNGTDKAWNILYRTTDSRYKPTFAVTTVFTPKKKVAQTKALLSYQIPYDTADVDASPSYALYAGGVIGAEAISPILQAGYFCNVPDYEGPLASFTAGVLSGHATIDSIRAVLSLHKTIGLDADAQYAMWGYSGGALASEWAAELQIQYAPEMKFVGAALGGLTPNVTSVLQSINGQASAGLAVSSILGLGSQYPEILEQYIAKLKTTGNFTKTEFLKGLNYSLTQASVAFYKQDLSQYFEDGFMDVFNNNTLQIVYNDGIMGYHGVPTMPLYVYKAVHDEISVIADTDALVDKYCNMGANIVYERNKLGSHAEEGTLGAPGALLWLLSAFSGSRNESYVTQGCKITTSSTNVTLPLMAISQRSIEDRFASL